LKLHIRALLASLLIIVLAACSNQTEPDSNPNAVFEFTIDPTTQSVNFESQAVFQTLATSKLQCGLKDPQTLIPETDLKLTSYDFSFLPNNELKIIAKFQNPTTNTYLNLNFEETGSSNIISSTEPLPTQALFATEETAELEFLVQHKGRGFSYFVEAKARVECEVQGEADLEVTKSDPVDPITLEQRAEEEGRLVTQVSLEDLEFAYTVIVKNIGTAIAENVILRDTFESVNPVSLTQDLPEGCLVEASDIDVTAIEANDESFIIVCELGDLEPDASRTFNFTYAPSRQMKPQPRPELSTTAIEPIAILVNTAEATTTSPESNLDNNIAVETTTLQTDVPEPVLIDFRIRKFVQAEGGADVLSTVVIPAAIFDWSCTEGSFGVITFTAAGLADGSQAATVAQILQGNTCTATERPQGDNWMVDQQTKEIVIQGEAASLTFTNTFVGPEPELGSVTVVKQVVGDGADADLEFDFFVNSSDATALPQEEFKLSANSTDKVFTNLPAETRVTIEEFFIPANYELTDMTCESDSAASVLNFSSEFDPGINSIAGIVDFQVRAGENVTCTFTNRLIQADLEVRILESDFSLAPLQYFVAPEYINNGPDTAENAILTVTLPMGIVFVGVTGCNNTPVVSDNQFTCELGDIASGANDFIDIEFSLADQSLTSVAFSAEINSDTLDLVPANNTDSNSFLLPEPGPETIECSIPGELAQIQTPPFNVFRLSFFDDFGCSPEATVNETYSARLTVDGVIYSGTANLDGTFDFTLASPIVVFPSSTDLLELRGFTFGGSPVLIRVNPFDVITGS